MRDNHQKGYSKRDNDVVFLAGFSTSSTFAAQEQFNQNTSLINTRRFLAIGLYDTGGDSVGEAREIHFDADITLGPGYDFIEV